MKKTIYLAISPLAFLSIFFPEISSQAKEAPRFLAIGEQASFPIEPGTRFSIGNPEVIQVKPTQMGQGGAILLVKGKAQGYSDLILLGDRGVRNTFSFRVVTKRDFAIQKDNSLVLGKESGVEMHSHGTGWVLRGKAQNIEDWNLSQSIEERNKGKVENLVRLHPLERLRAEAKIRKLLTNAGLSEIEVKGVGNLIVLEGDAASTQEKELAEQLSKQVIRNTRSHLRVPFENGGRLRFRAKILEVMKHSFRSLGLDWAEGVPSAVQLSKKITKFQFQLDAALNALERRGQVRVLSQPELLLNEKGIAELKVGGEIPIPSRTKNSASVQWKPYGLVLRLELPGVSKQRARAKIRVEMSSIDFANAIEGIPGIRLSQMETMVDLDIGKPILLSGLMENRKAETKNLLPLLGDIPILGQLFQSTDFQENRSELVILLEALK